MITFDHSPTITTKRLFLNAPNINDTEDIAAVLNHKLYYENTLNIPHPYTTEHAKFWVNLAEQGVRNHHFIFAIRKHDNPKIIGGIDLMINERFNQAEIGYWMDQSESNQGYTTEAVKAIVEFGFQKLDLKRIFATHFDTNPASGRVLEKAGMTKEGFLKCHTKKENNYQNHFLYAIINN